MTEVLMSKHEEIITLLGQVKSKVEAVQDESEAKYKASYEMILLDLAKAAGAAIALNELRKDEDK